MGKNPGAVNSLPPEQIIGELLTLRITAQQLLGGKPGYSASLHNLRQSSRKAKGIRKPCHFAVRAELLPKPAFSQRKLSDQALSSRQIGITLHIYRPFRHKLPCRRLFLHPLKQLRVILFQILQHSGGTQQKPVIRISLHQRQLIGIGSGRLPLCLLQGPQPGQIQMRLTKNGKIRCCIPVSFFQKRRQDPLPLPDTLAAPGLRCLKIHYTGKLLQSLTNLHGAQIPLRQRFPQFVERVIIRVGRKHFLVLYTEMTAPHHTLTRFRLRHRHILPLIDAAAFRSDPMSGIALRADFKDFSKSSAVCQFHHSMPAVNGTGLHAVYIHKHLRSRAQTQQNAFSHCAVGNLHTAHKPAVFPFFPPPRSPGKRPETLPLRLFQSHLFHGGKAHKFYLSQLYIQIPLKGFVPHLKPLVPLPSYSHHISLVPFTDKLRLPKRAHDLHASLVFLTKHIAFFAIIRYTSFRCCTNRMKNRLLFYAY